MPTLTFRADKDAYVAKDTPDTNHGAETTLKVASGGTLVAMDRRLLCSFDLRRLPLTAVRVVQATLRLVPVTQTPLRALRCHEVTGPWTESGVTWNNQPATGRDHSIQDSGRTSQAWEVTESVQARFPSGRADFRVRDDAEGSLLTQAQEYASHESAGKPPLLVVAYEDQAAADLASTVRVRASGAATLTTSLVLRRSSGSHMVSTVRPGHIAGSAALQTTVRPGSIPQSARLDATVRPGSIPGSAHLSSAVLVSIPREAALASAVRPRFRGCATFPSTVEPRIEASACFGSEVLPRLHGSASLASRTMPRPRRRVDLASTIAPRLTVILASCALRGALVTPIAVSEQDFLAISAEVGSTITHTSRGVTRTLRRVVQLVETRETVTFPREAPSERGKASTQDVLRRGDAILFALGHDVFRPDDVVGWQGLTWTVVGVLGAEMVGDLRVYQEVGLRRLPVTAAGGLSGTVARDDAAG